MSDEVKNQILTGGVASADSYKIKTAEALEEAARKLRSSDVSIKDEDLRNLLNDVESRVNDFKTEARAGYEKIEADYHKTIEPVERIIIEHPIPAVLIAAGIGVLIGILIIKSRD